METTGQIFHLVSTETRGVIVTTPDWPNRAALQMRLHIQEERPTSGRQSVQKTGWITMSPQAVQSHLELLAKAHAQMASASTAGPPASGPH